MVDISIKTIMTLEEANAADERVGMVIDAQGVLWYQGQEEMHRIDIIDAFFKDNSGESGNPGKITVWISLLAGESFIDKYVTTKSGDPLVNIAFAPEKDDSIIKLTFIEPAPDTAYFEALSFYTTLGVLDPGVSVRRGVGQ